MALRAKPTTDFVSSFREVCHCSKAFYEDTREQRITHFVPVWCRPEAIQPCDSLGHSNNLLKESHFTFLRSCWGLPSLQLWPLLLSTFFAALCLKHLFSFWITKNTGSELERPISQPALTEGHRVTEVTRGPLEGTQTLITDTPVLIWLNGLCLGMCVCWVPKNKSVYLLMLMLARMQLSTCLWSIPQLTGTDTNSEEYSYLGSIFNIFSKKASILSGNHPRWFRGCSW